MCKLKMKSPSPADRTTPSNVHHSSKIVHCRPTSIMSATPPRYNELVARFASLELSNNIDEMAPPLEKDQSPAVDLKRCARVRFSGGPATENNKTDRHPHALDLSASLKRSLAQRYYNSDDNDEGDDNQNPPPQYEHALDKLREKDAEDSDEPHTDDDADASNQELHGDVAPNEEHGVQENADEPMVRYEDFLSVNKLGQLGTQRFFKLSTKPGFDAAGSSRSTGSILHDAVMAGEDDDIVNLCSPVISSKFQSFPHGQSPRPNKAGTTSFQWSNRQFDQYFDLLGSLEHAFSSGTDVNEISISGAQIEAMGQLLESIISPNTKPSKRARFIERLTTVQE